MLTDDQIETAKARRVYSKSGFPRHEHNDCIRIAFEWLDAQNKTKGLRVARCALKHVIEKWAGRYISRSDVDVAAELHPDIRGTYPKFNISLRLTRPNIRRLTEIGEAFTHDYKEDPRDSIYTREESVNG